jgi:hypothetical protein
LQIISDFFTSLPSGGSKPEEWPGTLLSYYLWPRAWSF